MKSLLASLLTASQLTAPAAAALPSYNISTRYVAGVSSGGYMANQLHVAYSGTFAGAGIFTAGPYDCAQGDSLAITAQLACMNTLMPRKTPAYLEQETRDRAAAGTVDPVANLSGDPVYLYHGTSDSTVKQAVNDDLATYYRDLGADVLYNKTTAAGHAWVSPLGPNSCSLTASPYINKCGNDPEREMLGKLFGTVNAPAATPAGKLVQFDQNAYAPGGNAKAISMDARGFVYVPSKCESGSACRLIVALHGCQQYYGTIGDAFIKKAYLNEYADTNDTIVLYPQATTATGNPNGCWNWWGYGGDARYAQHGGKQIEAVMAMTRALG
jgi:poly(3-hydroxybutyrate) depolymerase